LTSFEIGDSWRLFRDSWGLKDFLRFLKDYLCIKKQERKERKKNKKREHRTGFFSNPWKEEEEEEE